MKLKQLKSRIVIAMAEPFIKSKGTRCVDPIYPSIKKTFGPLEMRLSTVVADKPYQRLDIWDKRDGKKVFSADCSSASVIRCEAGEWFSLFMSCFRFQAHLLIEDYLDMLEYRNKRAMAIPTNSKTHNPDGGSSGQSQGEPKEAQMMAE